MRIPSSPSIVQLAENIRKYGLISPIILDEGYNVLDGLHRLLALKYLGRTHLSSDEVLICDVKQKDAAILHRL